MTMRRAAEIGLVVGVAAALLARTAKAPDPPTPAPTEARPVSFASSSVPDARDYQVIEAVLRDLLDYRGKDSPLPTQGRGRARIIFDRTGAHSGPTRADTLEAFSQKRGMRLESREQATLPGLADEISRRNVAPVDFTAFAPRDKRIVSHTRSAPTSGSHSGLDRPVTAGLPGYTSAGDAALAWLVIPRGIHHAEGFYLLARQGNTWQVVRRSFLYYL